MGCPGTVTLGAHDHSDVQAGDSDAIRRRHALHLRLGVYTRDDLDPGNTGPERNWGELPRRTTPRALRFYEQRGLLPPTPRTANGQRWYGEGDLARVPVVRKLLSLGLTVEDVRRSPTASNCWTVTRSRLVAAPTATRAPAPSRTASPPSTPRSRAWSEHPLTNTRAAWSS